MYNMLGMPALGLTGVDIIQPFRAPIVLFDDFVDWFPMKFLGFAAGLTGGEYYGIDAGGGGSQALVPNQAGLNRNGQWVVLGTNSLSTLVTIKTTDTLGGGWITLTPAGADGDETIIQHFTAPINWGAFTEATKQAWAFQSRVRINSITTARQCVGVGPVSNANIMELAVTGSLVQGTVIFYILNGVVSYRLKTSATDTAITALTTASGDPVRVVAGGVYTFGITWDGISKLVLSMATGVGGSIVPLRSVSLPAFTGTSMTPVAGTGGIGAAVAPTMDVDYMLLVSTGPKDGR